MARYPSRALAVETASVWPERPNTSKSFGSESLGPLRQWTPQEVRWAQLRCAGMALTQPDPEAWLRDVLDALGLR